MSITPLFHGRVNHRGQLELVNPQWYEQHLRSLAGKDVEVIVRLPEKPASDALRRYYFGCLIKMYSEYSGMHPKEAHEDFKNRCLDPGIDSTTKLGSAEQVLYVERCRQFLAEQGILTPDPNEVLV